MASYWPYFFVTHWVFFNLLKSEPRPECVPCQCPLTVKRLLLEFVDTALARDHCYKVTTLKEVFNDISCETMVDFNYIRLDKIVIT